METVQPTKADLKKLLKKLPDLPLPQLQDLYRTFMEYEHVVTKEGA